jgi:hypothetical protein
LAQKASYCQLPAERVEMRATYVIYHSDYEYGGGSEIDGPRKVLDANDNTEKGLIGCQ